MVLCLYPLNLYLRPQTIPVRARYSHREQETKEVVGSIEERRILPQKTQSFKGERNKSPNWLQRRFSGQTGRDYDISDSVEYPTAVAAAAFAVKLLEESNIPDQRKTGGGLDTSMTKTKSKSEEITHASESRRGSRRFSDDVSMKNLDVPDDRGQKTIATDGKMPEKSVGPAPSIRKTITFADQLSNDNANKKPENAELGTSIYPAPAIRKTPTFADKLFDRTASRKTESQVPNPELPSTKQSTFSPAEIKRQSSTKPGGTESEADAWEKAEMAKIKEKYEKLAARILAWENERKTKAKTRLSKTEAELDRKRAKALRQYRSKIESIDHISGGARAQAEENQRNEEFKVKEKANKIRLTGRFPATCFCF
ncbi:unnamed protein product [Ilex paraguariensis]|uniref:Remorin C-terminal domain-containing protein n=1 Tax=Ilex paraguariensis TaxID=185542 RepID=A0ABC8UYJ3_9AQUA